MKNRGYPSPVARACSYVPLLGGALALVGCAVSADDDGPQARSTSHALEANVTYTFRNVHADKCLDVTDFSSSDGANLQLWQCTGQTAQQFTLVQEGGGFFSVRNVNSGKCLDVWAWSSEPGGNIAQYSCTGGANQQFRIEDVGGGAVRFVSRHSGMALDGWAWGSENGTNVAQWDTTGGANQAFVATRVGASEPPPAPVPPPTEECTNVRPTGTEWDSATCDDWAAYTSECNAAWMIDNHLCDRSCGRCGDDSSPPSPPAPQDRFVGNITTGGSVRSDFIQYWDQITPENEGKWGSVEWSRDSYNWGGLDAAYDYAKAHGIPFKQHTLVWGSQYPNWIDSLSPQEQAAEIEEWIRDYCNRYPDTDMIDVVNESTPGHAPAGYAERAFGSDWIIESFRLARQYCPNSTLILNDYNVLSWNTNEFIAMARPAVDAGVVDAIGLQSHGLENWSLNDIRNKLGQIVALGLPIYISEYDVNIADDNEQLRVFREQFELFWNTPQVAGITLWGYHHGQTWVPDSGLIRNGQPRPAMTWLMGFLGR